MLNFWLVFCFPEAGSYPQAARILVFLDYFLLKPVISDAGAESGAFHSAFQVQLVSSGCGASASLACPALGETP